MTGNANVAGGRATLAGVDDSARDPEPTTPGDSSGRDGQGRSPFDWCFRDRRTGRITVAQFPNVALGIFLATVALRLVVPTGTTGRTVVDGIGLAALAWWAVDEVVRGVNPWRRLLGVGGCVVVVSGLAALLR